MGLFEGKSYTCPKCKGKGTVYESNGSFWTDRKCSKCNGTGTVHEEAEIKFILWSALFIFIFGLFLLGTRTTFGG